MSTPYFISDLHIGHKSILKFSPCRKGTTVDEHDEWIIDCINSRVNKRDILYILGDVCFDKNKLHYINRMNGTKIMVRGNHDYFTIPEYLQYFSDIHGIFKYKGFWVSHAPMHPQELFGKINIHGHVHSNTVPDDNYINVCVEALNGIPISLDEIKEKESDIRRKIITNS